MKWNERGMAYMNKKQYFKYLVQRHKKLLLVVCVILFMTMVFPYITTEPVPDYRYGSYVSNQLYSLYLIGLLVSCGISFMTPYVLNSYLYRKQSCDLYLSLPMKRKDMFVTHVLFGVSAVTLPAMICFILSVIYQGLFGSLPWDMNVLYALILIVGSNIILQGIIHYICMKCNKLLDAVVAGFAFLIVPMIFALCFSSFLQNMMNEILVGHTYNGSSEWIISDYLIPMLSLPWHAISAFMLGLDGEQMRQTIAIQGNVGWLMLWWIVVGGLAYVRAYWNYIGRASEDSEQFTTSRIIYPTIIHSFLLGLMMLVYEIDSGFSSKWIILGLLFVMYLMMMFFAVRSIRFKIQYLLIFIGMYLAVGMSGWGFVRTAGLGLVEEIPNAANISEIYVSIYQIEEENGESITETANFHMYQDHEIQPVCNDIAILVEAVKDNESDGYYGFVEVEYEMENGMEVTREYLLQEQSAKRIAEEMVEEYMSAGYYSNR